MLLNIDSWCIVSRFADEFYFCCWWENNNSITLLLVFNKCFPGDGEINAAVLVV